MEPVVTALALRDDGFTKSLGEAVAADGAGFDAAQGQTLGLFARWPAADDLARPAAGPGGRGSRQDRGPGAPVRRTVAVPDGVTGFADATGSALRRPPGGTLSRLATRALPGASAARIDGVLGQVHRQRREPGLGGHRDRADVSGLRTARLRRPGKRRLDLDARPLAHPAAPGVPVVPGRGDGPPGSAGRAAVVGSPCHSPVSTGLRGQEVHLVNVTEAGPRPRGRAPWGPGLVVREGPDDHWRLTSTGVCPAPTAWPGRPSTSLTLTRTGGPSPWRGTARTHGVVVQAPVRGAPNPLRQFDHTIGLLPPRRKG